MLHHMKLQPEPFEKIRSGKKTIELRLFDPKRRRIAVGHKIEFLNLGDREQKIRAEVTGIYPFASFAELYQALPLSAPGYDEQEAERAEAREMEAYYSAEEVLRWGVVGIAIRVIPWKNNDMVRTSTYISLVLRHKPEAAGITLDKNGWADVEELVEGVSKTRFLSRGLLEEIVRTDEKGRYVFNRDKTKIRARYGHSVQVETDLPSCVPPSVLYHGTGEKYAESIEKTGLLPKGRLYVHLSEERSTATDVGARHGRPVIYQVEAGKMAAAGHKFFDAGNGIWLTDAVPPDFLKKG